MLLPIMKRETILTVSVETLALYLLLQTRAGGTFSLVCNRNDWPHQLLRKLQVQLKDFFWKRIHLN